MSQNQTQSQIPRPQSQIRLGDPRLEISFRIHNQSPFTIKIVNDTWSSPHQVEIVLFPRLKYREYETLCHGDYCKEETIREIEFDSKEYTECLNEEWVRGEWGYCDSKYIMSFWREVAERIENLDEVIEKTEKLLEKLLEQMGLLKMIERFLP